MFSQRTVLCIKCISQAQKPIYYIIYLKYKYDDDLCCDIQSPLNGSSMGDWMYVSNCEIPGKAHLFALVLLA